MGVTRWLLLVVAGIYAVLSIIAILAFIAGFYDAVANAWYNRNGSYVSLYVLVTDWAFFVIPTLLAYLAARDLKALPLEVVEKFQLKSLGFVGWLGAAMIIAGILAIVSAITSGNRILQINHIFDHINYELGFNQLGYAIQFIWLGALCLYARYRIAANKRLEVI